MTDDSGGPRGRHLATMTWMEVERARPDFPVVMLPLGAGAKEHGPHLPLNNDWLIAEYLARRVTEVARVLTLPTLPYGFYPAFVEYPGSVNIGRQTCADVVADVCRSFGRHGWRKFYVLNTGISTNRALASAKKALETEGLRLEYTDLTTACAEVERSVRESEGGSHADEIETSMMLYLAPEVVRRDRIVRDYHPDQGPGGLTRDPNATTGVYSPTGIWGDPTRATVEKGKVVVEALVAHLVEFLGRFEREGACDRGGPRTPQVAGP
ncbi:MAG: creatininase family protein [Planctomycetes bacterium]|nr:creatininase family protein [Planctomycetota bacterium]